MATTGFVLGTASANVTGSWSNLANVLAEDDTTTSFTTTTKSDDRLFRVYTFDFDTLLPANCTINAVNWKHRGSRSTGGTLEAWLRTGSSDGTASGNANTSLTTVTVSGAAKPGGGSWVRADLVNSAFEVRCRGLQPNNTTSRTYSFAWVEVEVDYTEIVAPTVTTAAVSDILIVTATGGGNVTADGGATITERGVCWNTSTTPTTANSKATAAGTTGAFTASLTGLSANTHYYVRAYAINSIGTSYGSQEEFDSLASTGYGAGNYGSGTYGPSAGGVTLTPSLFVSSATFYSQTLAASYRLTAALFADGDTFHSPTVAPGSVALTPALYSDGDTFYSHSLAASYSLTASLFADGDTFHTATVAPGGVTLTPSLFSDGDTFYGPTVSSGQSILAPDLYVDGDTFHAATVAPGSVTLAPSLFSDGDTFHAAAVAASYGLAPSLYTDADTFFAASAFASYGLAPSLFADGDTFFTPTVTASTQGATLSPGIFVSASEFFAAAVRFPIGNGWYRVPVNSAAWSGASPDSDIWTPVTPAETPWDTQAQSTDPWTPVTPGTSTWDQS